METHLNAVLTSDAQKNHSSKVIGGHHFLFTNEEKLGQFKNSCSTIVLKTSTKANKSLGTKTASKIPTHFRKASQSSSVNQTSTSICSSTKPEKEGAFYKEGGLVKITINSGTPALKAVRDPDKDMTVLRLVAQVVSTPAVLLNGIQSAALPFSRALQAVTVDPLIQQVCHGCL